MPVTESPCGERRGNPELRRVFDRAFTALAPYFDRRNDWAGGGHEHLAYLSIREEFPELGPEQVFVLISAIRSAYAHGRHPAGQRQSC